MIGFEEQLKIAFSVSGVSTKSLLYRHVVAVCKDLCISKLELAELLKNRPKPMPVDDSKQIWEYDVDKTDEWFEELEGLVAQKKGEGKS